MIKRCPVDFVVVFKDFWEREREWERERAWACAWVEGGAEGEGEVVRESQADSLLSTEPDAGLNLTTLRSWPELKSTVRRLTGWATQVPQQFSFLHLWRDNPILSFQNPKHQTCFQRLCLSWVSSVSLTMPGKLWKEKTQAIKSSIPLSVPGTYLCTTNLSQPVINR